MNTKKKRIAPKKRLIKHFLALTLAGSLLLPGLVLIQSQQVEASIIVDMASGVVGKLRYNATIAEIIVSLLSGSGANVTNQSWLNQINASYGVESTLATATGTDGTIGAMYEAGLFTVDNAGHFIDNGLADAIRAQSAYNSAGVSQLFETTVTDMELGAWQTADAATNLGEAASAGIALGTIGQVAGAVAMGVNLGILANKVVNWANKMMAAGAPVNTSDAVFNGIPSGYKMYRYRATTSFGYQDTYFFAPADSSMGSIDSDNRCRVWNVTGSTFSGLQRTITSRGSVSGLTSNNVYSKQNYLVGNGNNYVNQDGFNSMSSADITQYLADNNSIPSSDLPFSPDVIGPAGNQRPNTYKSPTSISNWPDLKPSDNLQQDNTGIKPIPWDEYMDQTTIFNQNTTNNNTTVQQGDVYNNFINNYITTPSSSETVETPDYNPTVPEQPTPNPKEELTSEVVQDTTDYMTTPGLKDVFPFSIPWDIAGLFNIFSTNNREAPVITFPIVSELFGIDEEVTIDLSPYDDVAALFRLLELIAFGLGLAFVTRYLIGAGG